MTEVNEYIPEQTVDIGFLTNPDDFNMQEAIIYGYEFKAGEDLPYRTLQATRQEIADDPTTFIDKVHGIDDFLKGKEEITQLADNVRTTLAVTENSDTNGSFKSDTRDLGTTSGEFEQATHEKGLDPVRQMVLGTTLTANSLLANTLVAKHLKGLEQRRITPLVSPLTNKQLRSKDGPDTTGISSPNDETDFIHSIDESHGLHHDGNRIVADGDPSKLEGYEPGMSNEEILALRLHQAAIEAERTGEDVIVGTTLPTTKLTTGYSSDVKERRSQRDRSYGNMFDNAQAYNAQIEERLVGTELSDGLNSHGSPNNGANDVRQTQLASGIAPTNAGKAHSAFATVVGGGEILSDHTRNQVRGAERNGPSARATAFIVHAPGKR